MASSPPQASEPSTHFRLWDPAVWTYSQCGPYGVVPTLYICRPYSDSVDIPCGPYSMVPTVWSLQCRPYRDSVDPTVWTLRCGPYSVDPTVWTYSVDPMVWTLQCGPYSVDRGEVELELLFWGHTLLSAIPHAVTQTTSILMPFCMWQPRWQAS